MIPILYAPSEKNFISNGLGRLAETTSCKVTEERNGQFELELIYPVTGRHFASLALGCILSATPADGKGRQAFRIYKISKPDRKSVV